MGNSLGKTLDTGLPSQTAVYTNLFQYDKICLKRDELKLIFLLTDCEWLRSNAEQLESTTVKTSEAAARAAAASAAGSEPGEVEVML